MFIGPYNLTKHGDKNRIKGNYYYILNSGEYILKYWCGKQFRNKEKDKEHNEKNKEKIKEYAAAYRKENKEKEKERFRKWRENNKEKIKEYKKKYYKENKEKRIEYQKKNREKRKEYDKKYNEANKEKRNKRQRERRKNDPKFKLISYIRTRVWGALRAKGAPKNKRTLEYLGCAIEYLYNYIEEQFTEGMSWDNQGAWQIDHRRCCDSFTFDTEQDKIMCFHYSNLQPMWGPENKAKSNTYDPLTFTHRWTGSCWVEK